MGGGAGVGDSPVVRAATAFPIRSRALFSLDETSHQYRLGGVWQQKWRSQLGRNAPKEGALPKDSARAQRGLSGRLHAA